MRLIGHLTVPMRVEVEYDPDEETPEDALLGRIYDLFETALRSGAGIFTDGTISILDYDEG